MRPIRSAILEVLNSSSELQFGFHSRLFNLTALANFIWPMLEAKTRKEVKTSSIVMALSRILRESKRRPTNQIQERFVIENISVQSGLIVITLNRTAENHRAAEIIYSRLRKKDSYFTMSEGSSEIALIFQGSYRELVLGLLPQRPKLIREKVASLSLRFHPKYIEVPGLLYKILQQISLQGINLVELASTATEFILYINEADVRNGFDTLLKGFSER